MTENPLWLHDQRPKCEHCGGGLDRKDGKVRPCPLCDDDRKGRP